VSRREQSLSAPKELEAFLKAMKAETVTLSLVNKKFLKVEAEASTTLEGYEAEDFPPVPGSRARRSR
jgi:hypothetical protein